MTAVALLTDLTRRGVCLTTADGRLRYAAPRGVLTAEDRAALARNKAALVALLNPPAPSSWDSLAAQRWGPGLTDSTPGIVIDHPDSIGRAERLTRIYAEGAIDPDAIEERRAIQEIEAEAEEQNRRGRSCEPQECYRPPMSPEAELVFDRDMLRRAKLDYMRAIVRYAYASADCVFALAALYAGRRDAIAARDRYLAAKAEGCCPGTFVQLQLEFRRARCVFREDKDRLRNRRALLSDALDHLSWQRDAYARARADYEAKHPGVIDQAA